MSRKTGALRQLKPLRERSPRKRLMKESEPAAESRGAGSTGVGLRTGPAPILTPKSSEALEFLGRIRGQSVSELIQEAVDQYVRKRLRSRELRNAFANYRRRRR